MTLPRVINEPVVHQTPASLSYKLISAEQVRANEQTAAAALGCSMFELMQRAGQGAFKCLQHCYPYAGQILVLAGWGNNAGDGYVLARLAQQQGLSVTLACADPQHPLSGDALQAQSQWLEQGNSLLHWQSVDFSRFDVIVDALLGTGLHGEIRPLMADIIHCVNAAKVPVLSIDLPSGLDADSGTAMPVAIQAHTTITFVAIKPGLVTGQGKSCCGTLLVDHLGIAGAFYPRAELSAVLLNWASLAPLVKRPLHANKGHFGRVLCIGGNAGMAGAIRLCGEAALRSGAGLVKVFCHQQSHLQVASSRPELMLCQDHQADTLQQALDWSSCIALGPGLGTDSWAQTQFSQCLDYLRQHPKPLLLDADALNLLASSDSQTLLPPLAECILTPHPGEASRLLHCTVADIERQRYRATTQLVKKYAATAILKGAGTVIGSSCRATDSHSADPVLSDLTVCADGNPGMATAGMGDVLSGIAVAMLAQGLAASQAAVYAVCLHAAAGDKVASEYGQRGILASDLFQPIRALVN